MLLVHIRSVMVGETMEHLLLLETRSYAASCEKPKRMMDNAGLSQRAKLDASLLAEVPSYSLSENSSGRFVIV